ncbi:unnamed protein product [Phytomonas sp. Hart1]|nr:unnamed protein product [Phytomonas sp. Hart1]|eukprot:CCW68889.1 unnamed protein product [Phytomonas sp. isolate Hart1]
MTYVVTHSNIQKEQERVTATIEQYNTQLQEIDEQILEIEQKKKEITHQIQDHEEKTLNFHVDLAAHDGLDSIIRLENKLKITQRCNHLLSRENETQERLLEARTKKLKKISDEIDNISFTTGWCDNVSDTNDQDVDKQNAAIQEILGVEAKTREEIRSTDKNIKKKERTILKLHVNAGHNQELQVRLTRIQNEVRFRQRECRELETKLKRMQTQDIPVEQELVKLEEKTIPLSQSLTCMEKDKEFLAEAVRESKMICSRQENVIKAQLARQEQLQSRLDAVMKSLHVMDLAKDFEQNTSKSALVPVSAREEPENVSQILPEDERIPIDTYRLLYKNGEITRTNLARKNMLVLEKESVIQATEEKLQQLIDKHNLNARHGDAQHVNADDQIRNFLETLQTKQEDYRTRLDALVADNKRLRIELSRKSRNRRRVIASGSR